MESRILPFQLVKEVLVLDNKLGKLRKPWALRITAVATFSMRYGVFQERKSLKIYK